MATEHIFTPSQTRRNAKAIAQALADHDNVNHDQAERIATDMASKYVWSVRRDAYHAEIVAAFSARYQVATQPVKPTTPKRQPGPVVVVEPAPADDYTIASGGVVIAQVEHHDITQSAPSSDGAVHVQQADLKAALTRVMRVMSRRISWGLLQNVCLDVAKGKVRIYTTDLETMAVETIDAQTPAAPVRMLIDGRRLLTFVRDLNAGAVSIRVSTRIVVSSGDTSMTFEAGNPDEFPVVPAGADMTSITALHSDVVRDMAAAVVMAAARDESRPALACVNLQQPKAQPGLLRAAAADGFRMAIWEHTPDTITAQFDRAMVRAGALKILAQNMARPGHQVEILETASALIFKHHTGMIVAQKVDGNYPDVKQIAPATTTAAVTIDADALMAALKPLPAKLNDDRVHIMQLENGIVKLTVSIDGERTEATVNASRVNDKARLPLLAMNQTYLMDTLAYFKGRDIEISGNGRNVAVLVQENRPDAHVQHVIMPMVIADKKEEQ